MDECIKHKTHRCLYDNKMKPFKEIKRTDKLLFICPFCGLSFRALAYHTNRKHGIIGKHLRKMFGLKASYQLITHDLKQLHRNLAIKHNEGEKLKRVGLKTRYKKGDKGHTKDSWSPQAIWNIKHNRKGK